MILHTETGEDDKKDVKDRILDFFWCKFHYIYLSAFLCLGKKVLVSMCQVGLMMSGKREYMHTEPIIVQVLVPAEMSDSQVSNKVSC